MQFLLWLLVFGIVLRQERANHRPLPEAFIFAMTMGIVAIVVVNVALAEVVMGLATIPWWIWVILVIGTLSYLVHTFIIRPLSGRGNIFP